MHIFQPTAVRERVTEITPQFLQSLGVRALLLDVDNTLATYTSHAPSPGALEWVKAMGEAGFRMIIISNNGDQIFTDIVGANLCGMKSVLLSPIEPEEGFTFKVRRHFERGLREKFSSRKEVLK